MIQNTWFDPHTETIKHGQIMPALLLSTAKTLPEDARNFLQNLCNKSYSLLISAVDAYGYTDEEEYLKIEILMEIKESLEMLALLSLWGIVPGDNNG